MIKENQKYLNRLLVIFDGLAVFISLILAWIIRFKLKIIPIAEGYLLFKDYIRPAVFMIPIYLIIYASFKLYMPQRFKRTTAELVNIFKANTVGFLVFIFVLYIMKIIDYSRILLIIFGFVCIIITSLERTIVRNTLSHFRSMGYNIKHILIVGVSDITYEFLARIDRNRDWGYNVFGIVDDTSVIGSRVNGKEVVGNIEDLGGVLSQNLIDDVFVTIDMSEYSKLGNIISACEKNGVRTNIIPSYYKYIPAKPYLEEIDGLPVINIRYVPLDNIMNRFTKRVVDVVGSFIAIILFSPVMILCAIAVKLSSEGPILYKQERIGLNKRSFMMLKFRSMKVVANAEEKTKWTTKHDPRKTKVGEFIRKTSIDELPQLFNVLAGDMSLVGPRPERPYFVEQFKEEVPKYMIKHQIRPGITGWAQVNGLRGDTSIKKRIECDLYYIENWNLLFDIKILLLTVLKGFINENAY